jgi:hypothetical protein
MEPAEKSAAEIIAERIAEKWFASPEWKAWFAEWEGLTVPERDNQ